MVAAHAVLGFEMADDRLDGGVPSHLPFDCRRDAALAQGLVGDVVGVLEDRKSCHQSRRQRRTAGPLRVDRPELLLQEPPVDCPRQPDQRMLHVNDRIKRIHPVKALHPTS